MNYVIYGAGYRGKKLLNYIKKENIIAFIDSDKEKQGKEYCGKPIISIEEYKKKYESYFIIITPTYCNNIEDMLEEHNIYQYENLTNMPSEFSGYGYCQFEDCYDGLRHNFDKPFCVYGLNALSLLIYDFLCKDNEIVICPERNCKLEKIEWIKKFYPKVKVKKFTEIQSDVIMLISIMGAIEEKFSHTALNLFEYANDNKQYWNEKLRKLNNLYKEKKRCFIVATGPSLCIDDLHILKANDIFCFGVNSILRIGKEWMADGYVATDSHFINNNMQYIKNYNCDFKFIGDACQEYWTKEREDSYKIHVAKAGSGLDFSEEICQKLYCGHSGSGMVTYVCLQLAVYMGFTEIYLLGVDCNYVMGSTNNHFIEDDVVDNKDHGVNLMIKAYEYAKKYADSHGIKIYNATRGGMLEVFERVDFDSLFEGKN